MAPVRGSLLKKKIEQLQRRSGFDPNIDLAIAHHLIVVNNFIDDKPIRSRESMCELLLSNFFIEKIDLYPTAKSECSVDENSDWPVPVLPAEIFSNPKLPDEDRKMFFFECLRSGDSLDCRVSSVKPTEYELRVIHKYGVTRLLDDLNLMVTMKRTKEELTVLQKDLLLGEIIRVAVVQVEGEKVLVTVDAKSLNILKKLPELGRISGKELPSYVLDHPDPEKYLTYGNYLDSMPKFINPILLNTIQEDSGLKLKDMYSYYDRFNELMYTDEMSGQFLYNELKKKESKVYADAARKEHGKRNYDEALALIEKAIQICPKDDSALAAYYDHMGKLHLQRDSSFEEFARYEAAAYDLNHNNQQAKTGLSKLLYKAAMGWYKKKEYKKSAFLAEKSLEVCPNKLASTLLHVLKTYHPDVFMNLEKDTMHELVTKKKQLVTELKNMQISKTGVNLKDVQLSSELKKQKGISSRTKIS